MLKNHKLVDSQGGHLEAFKKIILKEGEKQGLAVSIAVM
jgi:hypothetical protein